MKKSSKNKCLKNQLITRATLAALALITVANPETKAAFSPSSGTVNNDNIIGSGSFIGSLNAT
jgi:hypothetical protein